MNLILTICDTQRRDHLGCYGTPPAAGEFESRAVDGLAKRETIGEAFPSELYHLPSDPWQEHDVLARPISAGDQP